MKDRLLEIEIPGWIMHFRASHIVSVCRTPNACATDTAYLYLAGRDIGWAISDETAQMLLKVMKELADEYR